MSRIFGLSYAALALFVGVAASAGPANAVIYCKTEGVPQGCVVRPAVVTPVVVAPAPAVGALVVAPVDAPVVICKRRGFPRGCVVR